MLQRLNVKYPYSCRILMKRQLHRHIFGGGKMLIYQVSSKSVQWEPSCSMRTERQADMKRIIAFCNFANAPKSGKPVLFSTLSDLTKGKNTHTAARSGQQLVIQYGETNRPFCFHELHHKLLAAPLYVSFYPNSVDQSHSWKADSYPASQ
jgi:hypothetical protein